MCIRDSCISIVFGLHSKIALSKASESISWADLENDARRIDIIDKLNIIEKLKL